MNIAITKEGSALYAILLITGCCIGAGMIGLPVVSAAAGFIPSMLAMVLCYLFAVCTGLLLLEATLWFNKKINLISMAGFALGKAGKVFTGTLFISLFYCLFVAYMDAGGQLFAQGLSALLHLPVSREIGIGCCLGLLGAIFYCGLRAVNLINVLFVIGLAVSYCTMLSLGLPYVEAEKLEYANWTAMLSTVPILLLCFGYQNLVPTLTYFLKKEVAVIRRALIVGNLIPFLIYFLWNFVILGLMPPAGSAAFDEALSQANMVTGLLQNASQSGQVLLFAQSFALFAILTSIIANTISIVDFLKDGLHQVKLHAFAHRELPLYALVLAPPAVLTLFYPHLFLKALNFAGGVVDLLLFGILPVLIVAIGRYVKKVEGPYTAPGGKLLLIAILLFSVVLLFIQN